MALAPSVSTVFVQLLPWLGDVVVSDSNPGVVTVTTPSLTPFWCENSVLHAFLYAKCHLFSAEHTKVPDFSVSSVSGSGLLAGNYCVSRSGLKHWHNQRWNVVELFASDDQADVLFLPSSVLYFRLLK